MAPERLFLANGLLRKALTAGGWLPLSLILVVDLNFSPLQLLLMGTAIELGVLLGEVPTGVMADVFSRKWSVVLGGAFISSAQLASGIVDQWELYLVTQFVWGIGWTFISGAEIAWVTDETGSAADVEPLLLRRGRLNFVAIMAGLLVFAVASQVVDRRTVVIAAGTLGLTWAAGLAVVMSETGFTPSREQHWQSFRTKLVLGATFTWHHRSLRALGIGLLVGGMAAEAMDRLDSRRLEDLGLSADTNPTLVLAMVMMGQAALGWFLLWRFESRVVGRRVVDGFAAALLVVGFLAIMLAHTPILIVAAIGIMVQGGLLDVTEPLIGTWTNALAPSDARATVHSFIGQTLALGEIAGGVLLGTVAAIFTLPTAWTVAGGLFVLAAGVMWSGRPHWSASPGPLTGRQNRPS